MRGSRPGERRGGRQKGTPNRRTVELQNAANEAAAVLESVIPGAFRGDAHAYLMSIYKDPRNEPALRVDAAKAAIRYEKPALSSVDGKHSGALDIRGWLQAIGEPD